jgi:hypothetical protein
MVDARMTVSRGRTLEKYKLGTALALFDRTPEHILFSPHLKDVVVHLSQIQAVMFGKFLGHIFKL